MLPSRREALFFAAAVPLDDLQIGLALPARLRLPWRQVHFAGESSPSLIGKRKWRKWSGSLGRHVAPKKERRTDASHRRPAQR
jgi:hypothetical protein